MGVVDDHFGEKIRTRVLKTEVRLVILSCV